MDIYCPRCGEPWDMDELHFEAEDRAARGDKDATYESVARDFRRRGCAALGGQCSDSPNTDRAEAASILYDMLGDDLDGAAALLEDMGL
jgi:hypothetical protein